MAGLVGAVALMLVAATVVLVAIPRPGPVEAAAATNLTRNPYVGLGAWVDMYSWSDSFTGAAPHFGLADVDAMAAQGVQTLYIQAASQTGPATVLEADRLLALIAQAHRVGVAVVVWYLPSLVNLADDMARLLEISNLPSEGIAVDIESTDVADVAARNAALVSLSRQLHLAVPTRPLGAVVLPATQLEVINTHYWPSFPYADLAPFYDTWLPMVYWTGRLPESGFHDGYRYTADSIERLRADLGPRLGPMAKVNPIGGVSVDGMAPSDMAGFVKAVKDTHSQGGSIYEWPGTDLGAWAVLRALRS
jgi:hypothetical protein